MAERETRYHLEWPGLQYLYAKIRKRLDNKVEKDGDKGLSSFDFDKDYKEALDTLEETYVKKDGEKGLSSRDYTDLDWWRLNRLVSRFNIDTPPVYTVKIHKTEEDPYKKVEYDDDAKYMTPVSVDATRKAIDLGDWENDVIWDAISYVMLDYNTKKEEVCDPDKFNRRADGSGGTNYNIADAPENLMVKLKTFYMRLREDENYYIISISTRQYDGFTPVGFTRADSTIAGNIYIGSYMAKNINSKLRSIKHTVGAGAYEFKTALSKLKNDYGDSYQILNIQQKTLLTALFLLLFKTTDIRGAIPSSTPGADPFTLKNGIGWDQDGSPIFLGLNGFTHITGNMGEFIAGYEKSKNGETFLKVFPPYDNEGQFTAESTKVGILGKGAVSRIQLYQNLNVIEPSDTLSTGMTGYFVDRMEYESTAYNPTRLVARATEGLFGYDITALRDGGDSKMGGLRFVYIPEA